MTNDALGEHRSNRNFWCSLLRAVKLWHILLALVRITRRQRFALVVYRERRYSPRAPVADAVLEGRGHRVAGCRPRSFGGGDA